MTGEYNHEQIVQFWFSELSFDDWFKKDDSLDARIRKRFAGVHASACVGELYSWRTKAEGRLAEIIILDQFSRNMYRGLPASFTADPLALALAQEAVAVGADKNLTEHERNFMYMPYMHSESALIHQAGLPLFERNGSEGVIKYAHLHKNIIDKFGRYPHRNDILGRKSTPEELEFLQQPDSSF